MKRNFLILSTVAVLGLSSVGSSAQLVSPVFNNYSGTLGGTTANYQWSGTTFTSENRPAGVSVGTAGTAGQWVTGTDSGATNHGIVSNDGSTDNRFYVPTTGTGPFSAAFASDTVDFLTTAQQGGIYAFFSQTHFEVTSTDPLPALKSLVFQVSLAEGLTGAFGGGPADLAVAPTLTLTTTGGSVILNAAAADFSLLQTRTPIHIDAFNMDSYLVTLGYQWDLSSVSQAITGYSIDWQTSYHSVTYGANATESTATHASSVLAVPEPSTYALIGLGVSVLLIQLRKRRLVRA